MYKCRNYFDKGTMRNLYFSFIYPYLTYCVEIWGNACNIHLDPIVKLQKKCIRTITYSSYLEHTQPLFDSLNCYYFLSIFLFTYNKNLLSPKKKKKKKIFMFSQINHPANFSNYV